jgi:hypothetical protein
MIVRVAMAIFGSLLMAIAMAWGGSHGKARLIRAARRRFVWRRRRHRVTCADGPQRIAEERWQPDGSGDVNAIRDYYRVAGPGSCADG